MSRGPPQKIANHRNLSPIFACSDPLHPPIDAIAFLLRLRSKESAQNPSSSRFQSNTSIIPTTDRCSTLPTVPFDTMTRLSLPLTASLLAAGACSAFVPTIQTTTISTTSRATSSSSFLLAAKPKIFIDGEAGTTGLQVRDRLAARDDLEILSIPDDLRKDDATRKKLINEADAVILCELLACSDRMLIDDSSTVDTYDCLGFSSPCFFKKWRIECSF